MPKPGLPWGTGLLGISERSAHEDVIIVDPALDRPVGHKARLTGGEIVDVRAEAAVSGVIEIRDLRAVRRPFLEPVVDVESSDDAVPIRRCSRGSTGCAASTKS